MSQEVEDHKELWESEIKSKSKLGLRVSLLTERGIAKVVEFKNII